MDTTAGVIEAEVDLDGEALRIQHRRRNVESGKVASTAAKGGVEVAEGEQRDRVDEESPLLDRRRLNGGQEGEERENEEQPWGVEFAHLPWYKRPSPYWMIVPFFIMACAFGGIITPKLNLILDLICREYISDRMTAHPGFTMAPVDFNNGNNNQCRIPEVQSRVAQFTLWGNLISGLLAAFTSPKLGALSDRYGRKPILIATSCGTILGEIITICAAVYPETFPVPLLLLSFALDGLTGSFLLAMGISNAYAADCVPPSRRSVIFGYFHASLFTGIAIGPIIAGYIVKYTGRIVTVFYIMGGTHLAFALFVAFVVPESLSKKRQLLAREKHENLMIERGSNWDWINQLRQLNVLEPLKVLRPTGPGSSPALRWNLLALAAVDTIVFGVAMGSMTVVIYYMNYQFGWQTFESGRFLTIVNSARVICLLVILPAVTRMVKGKAEQPISNKYRGSDSFDLATIRIANFFDMLGFLGYSLSKTGGQFIASGVIASIGGVGSPALQASLTKHIPADQTGQLLGAIGLLHALARIIAPAVFGAIYSATVGKFTQTVFVCLCATFGLAFLTSWFIRPGVYFDEDAAANAEGSDAIAQDADRYIDRMPIVSAADDAAQNMVSRLGFRSSGTEMVL